MRRTADAIVVGAGIVGSSIALELARRGRDTLVVDRHADAGRGSTKSSTAIIRSFYGTRPAIALATEGRRVFEQWPEHVGNDRPRASFRPVGCALLLASSDPAGDEIAQLMRSADVAVESLSGREASGLVPGIRAARTRVLFECGAGYVSNPAHATLDVRKAAERHGARFDFGQQVVEIRNASTRNGRRRIAGITTASGARIDAPVVINAAGPHSARLNLMAHAPLALNTVPVAQYMLDGTMTSGADLPVVADLPAGQYARFAGDRIRVGTLATARDALDWIDDPDRRLRVPRSFAADRRRAFQRRHPAQRWTGARAACALYDVTVQDWYPIIDRTDVDGYYVAIGTSGTWFKGSPTIGLLIAELIAAVESGRDHDSKPLDVRLPHTRHRFDLGFLSRNRAPIRSELGSGVLG